MNVCCLARLCSLSLSVPVPVSAKAPVSHGTQAQRAGKAALSQRSVQASPGPGFRRILFYQTSRAKTDLFPLLGPWWARGGEDEGEDEQEHDHDHDHDGNLMDETRRGFCLGRCRVSRTLSVHTIRTYVHLIRTSYRGAVSRWRCAFLRRDTVTFGRALWPSHRKGCMKLKSQSKRAPQSEASITPLLIHIAHSRVFREPPWKADRIVRYVEEIRDTWAHPDPPSSSLQEDAVFLLWRAGHRCAVVSTSQEQAASLGCHHVGRLPFVFCQCHVCFWAASPHPYSKVHAVTVPSVLRTVQWYIPQYIHTQYTR